MYIYMDHLYGGLYAEEEMLDYDRLYCEICGDSDIYIGCADSSEAAWELLKDECDIDGSGGYEVQYVKDCINRWFAEED